MKKQILLVQHEDGTVEVTCKVCKSKMIWRDLGEAPSMVAGNLVQQDFSGFWDCTKCGYQSDE